MHICFYIYIYIYTYRPTQSIMYVPLQVNRFQKRILLIVLYKYLKPCSRDFILQKLILCTKSCGTGFITQSSWAFHFHQTTLVWWKCSCTTVVPVSKAISGGPALNYFYMIHRGVRYMYIYNLSCIYVYIQSFANILCCICTYTIFRVRCVWGQFFWTN